MQQNNNIGDMILGLLLDEMRKVVRDELSNCCERLKPSLASREPVRAPKRFWTLKETATELNLSSATVRRLVDRGLLRASKATRHIRISKRCDRKVCAIRGAFVKIGPGCRGWLRRFQRHQGCAALLRDCRFMLGGTMNTKLSPFLELEINTLSL